MDNNFMIEELNKILWWIPSKKIRDSIRNIYNNKTSKLEELNQRINNLEYLNSVLFNDKTTKDRILAYSMHTSNLSSYKIQKWHLEDIASKALGYFINLDNPRSLNEKINWLKLNYRNPLMKICADKYTFKEYIKSQLGEGYTIPLLGVWDNVNDIDFNKLPNQFVLKSNAGSLSREIIIVKDKNNININEIKIKMNDWLQPWNASGHGSNWFFLNIPQRIIAEEYVEEIENSLEYSFYCSFGNILFILLDENKTYYIDNRTSFYDINWNKLPVKRPNLDEIQNFKIPINSDDMKIISEKLSKDFPLVRIDFYNTKEKLLVGELTFYPAGGCARFEPVEWDYKFGDMIDLDNIAKEHLSREWLEILEKK
ncbi:ATP-grasp fold amidoligase family protein [Brachyspira intermedia]|uniref:ATP-grasp fold amidoligase family protein n=1 Tax=Brachyspira intermedia TaxID=84377 RepID=UPI0030042A94